MTDNIIRHLGDLDLHGNLTLLSQVTDFPANPRIGTMVMKNNCMYVYALIGSLETWYPYASATASYIHTQGLAAQTWTVTHNLDSLNLWFQVKDSDGNILAVNKTDVNRNVFTLNFTTPVVGTVVVVAPEKIDVPQVRATGLIVGNNNEVVVDSSGVLINGSYALTTAVISSEIATAVSGEATLRANADTTLTSNLASEVTRAQSAEASLTSSIATEASSRVSGDTALQGQIDSILSNVDATALNSLSEIVTAFQAADGTLNGAITTLAGSVTTGLEGKVDKVAGKGLSTEDYSTAEKTKLAGIAEGAQVNVVTSVAAKTGDVTLVKADVGLANVDNTSDASKPVSTAMQTALDAKEGTVTAGTTSQYYRGDKTWQTLPTIPTVVSAFTNDSEYQTASQVSTAIASSKILPFTKSDGSASNLTLASGYIPFTKADGTASNLAI